MQLFFSICGFNFQVELVLSQFQRAKGRVDTPDAELHEDLLSIYSKSIDAAIDQVVLRQLVEKLQLTGIADLTQESCALHEMITATGEDTEERIEKMSVILRKMKVFVLTENPESDSSSREKSSTCSGQASTGTTYKAPVIPDDFRCPISLELMKDPVIVSSGQVPLLDLYLAFFPVKIGCLIIHFSCFLMTAKMFLTESFRFFYLAFVRIHNYYLVLVHAWM